jgi:hypothetical protein
MKKSYQDIERCGSQNTELTDYNADIEKDLLRTFPKVPQFAFYQGNNYEKDNDKI